MSRSWNKQDEIYIYKENIKIKKEIIESLINRINANTKYELHLTNIMNVYDDKLNILINALGDNGIDYFSPSYNKKTFIYETLDDYLKKATNELTKLNNKLINPKYTSIVNSKLMLLLIRKNINKYNLIIKELQELEILNLS